MNFHAFMHNHVDILNTSLQIRNTNSGVGYGQEKTYCGNEKPPGFYGIGPRAEVKVKLDTTGVTAGVPEFRAKYQAEPELKNLSLESFSRIVYFYNFLRFVCRNYFVGVLEDSRKIKKISKNTKQFPKILQVLEN